MSDFGLGVYAIFDTTLGEFTCRLFADKAPETVANFRGLAEGTKEFVDSKTGARVKRRYYDGFTFHRVIPKFMIQGGCPEGTGTGGPGYQFGDEFASDLTFDRPGKLAMANAGPNTNGSQFFICSADCTNKLEKKYNLFGRVVEGMDTVDKINNVEVVALPNGMRRPVKPIKIIKATVV